jgi:uncharacterized protein (TIGR02757 family)
VTATSPSPHVRVLVRTPKVCSPCLRRDVHNDLVKRARWMVNLESAYATAPWDEWVCGDPLWHVLQHPDPRDREIVGLVAASLAYGRVASIMSSVERVLAAMDHRPYEFLMAFDARDAERFSDCVHRFHTPVAIVATLTGARRVIQKHGSLKEAFLNGWSSRHPDTTAALASFVALLRENSGPLETPELYGLRHFLACPNDGSACKRLNLYLRWMVRTGTPDTGAWPEVYPAALLMPVDVHVARIARRMRWTRLATPNLAMAREITASLRRADSRDPTRFDFVISHLGMDGLDLHLQSNPVLTS